MHAALLVAEIFRIIVDEAYLLDPAHCASLARTCRAFTDIALDALWAYQYNLAPLIMTMPSDLWTEEITTEGLSYLRFIRSNRSSDWERFDFYARRIRSFGDDQPFIEDIFPRACISHRIFRAIERRVVYAPVFPNLRRLTWRWPLGAWEIDDPEIPEEFDMEHWKYSAFIHIFLGGRIKSISIYNWPSHRANTFDLLCNISSFPSECPSLEELFLDYPLDEDSLGSEFLSNLSDAVMKMNRLTSFHVRCHFKPGVLEHLATLPSLSTLRLYWLPEHRHLLPPPSFSISAPPPTPLFRNLRTIDIKTLSIRPFISLFASSPQAPLEDISIELLTIEPTSLIKEFLTALTNSNGRLLDSLKWLSLRSLADDEVHVQDESDGALYLRQIFVFHNMAWFTWPSTYIFRDWDESTILDLAFAWPHLRSLDLQVDDSRGRPPTNLKELTISLRILEILVRNCPGFCSISVPFDARAADIKERLGHIQGLGKTTPEDPASLWVNTSIIREEEEGDLEIIAQYLSHLFPDLDGETFLWESKIFPIGTEMRRRWKMVWNIMKSIRKERAAPHGEVQLWPIFTKQRRQGG
ncbi:hypothetical protein JAAARDRAFT_206673 [Jaapia argillacea MUCL 33604]|uniref:F-box domain-containing protein n=1 Tax=Jaapia argillacea MUCL 33604 TaxID=933084 RepID=A0A067PVK7_9AGAM|nr:hypothetical protein JAAARDRAFT_206673 [Jaapia argillacea MUCL 33604]